MAPLNHQQICVPKRMLAESMSCFEGDSCLVRQASAASGEASLKATSVYLAAISAITKTIPESRMVFPTSISSNHKAAKSLPRKVFYVGVWFSGIMKGHGDLLSRYVRPWDVDASPGQLICISPLYHKRKQYSCLLGVDSA
jgi:hypothetical protein